MDEKAWILIRWLNQKPADLKKVRFMSNMVNIVDG